MKFWKWLRNIFLTGVFVTIPVGITVWLFIWIFNAINGILQPLIDSMLNRTIPGLGFVVMIVLIFLIGIIASNFLGKRLISLMDKLLTSIPGVKSVYGSVKQVIDSFSQKSESSFKSVVIVSAPVTGVKLFGLVTNEITGKDGQKYLYVFIPDAPNPISGILEIVKADEVIEVDMTVEDALQMIISVGKVVPKEMRTDFSL